MALFKVVPAILGTQHPHACRTSHIKTYKRRCPIVTKSLNEHGRMPRFLETAECAANCDPKCCAVVFSVPVLKKQRSEMGRKLDTWVLQRQEIVVDYIRP